MRALAQKRLLLRSVPAGAGIALLCTPLIFEETHHPALRILQLSVLPFLCILLVQAALAWTPDRLRCPPALARLAPRRFWIEAVLLALAAALFRMAMDPAIARMLLLTPVSSWEAFARKAPFAVLVQPLFLVLAVYAFTLRLSYSETLASATVVLAHQTVVLLQFAGAVSLGALAFILVVAGIEGLVLAFAYHRHGLCGTLLVAALVHARHGIYLLVG
ncbi:MAG: hypothetical protein JXR77_09805 [Lentisphaeria bacterium]|nr:hypothetical protein [Lentisphaeria bacterium]